MVPTQLVRFPNEIWEWKINDTEQQPYFLYFFHMYTYDTSLFKLCRIGYSMSRFSYYFTCFAIKLTKFWIRIWKYLLGSISSWQNHFPVLSCFIDYCLKYNSISLLWLFSKHCTGMIQFFRTFFPCKCIMILILFFIFFLNVTVYMIG